MSLSEAYRAAMKRADLEAGEFILAVAKNYGLETSDNPAYAENRSRLLAESAADLERRNTLEKAWFILVHRTRKLLLFISYASTSIDAMKQRN